MESDEADEEPVNVELAPLEEMDENLVYVDGQGWMEPEDAEGLGGMTLAEMKHADEEYEARRVAGKP